MTPTAGVDPLIALAVGLKPRGLCDPRAAPVSHRLAGPGAFQHLSKGSS